MEIIQSPALLHQIGWTLIHSLWLDAVIGLLLLAGLKLLHRAKPQIRYSLACTALAAMIVFPVITTGILNTAQTDFPDSEDDTASIVAVNADYPAKAGINLSQAKENSKISSLTPSLNDNWNIAEKIETSFPWLILCWLLGVMIFTVKLSGGLIYTRNLRKLAAASSNTRLKNMLDELTGKVSIKRKIKIIESALVNVPTTIGWLYPIILIPPSSLLGLTPVQLQTIIVHELIHIKRYDFLVNFLQRAAEIILFYHPAARWASRRIREEREYICDDLTLAVCEDSLVYARALTLVARFQKQSGELALAANGGDLKSRIYRLISNSQSPARIEKSFLQNSVTFLIIGLFLLAVFGGMQFLPAINGNALAHEITGNSPESKKEAENNTVGEYGDDLSKENLRFRKITVQALNGHRGTAIIMNPQTGQIYTIVNQDWALRRNWTPASTFKMVTTLAGLEEKQLKESSKGFGYDSAAQLNLTRALAVSNNDYFKSLGKDLGSEILIKYFKQLGFGVKTGINYPDETVGSVTDTAGNNRSDFLGMAGGETKISPIQLAVFISAIANGGKILVPQATNENVAINPQERSTLAVSEDSLAELKKGLRAAVESGTAKGANQANYTVSGKTGSAFNRDSKIGLFASYGVSNNSQMVVVVATEGKNESGAGAAQIAGKIYNSI